MKSLDQVVPVEYVMPGCPPEPQQICGSDGGDHLGRRRCRPPGGAIIGAGKVAVCEECPREKNVKQIERFYRPHEITPDPDICLLEQGMVCMGIGDALRLWRALSAGRTCAARAATGRWTMWRTRGRRWWLRHRLGDQTGRGRWPASTRMSWRTEIGAVMDTLVDPAGTFYRFNMAHSLLRVPDRRGQALRKEPLDEADHH